MTEIILIGISCLIMLIYLTTYILQCGLPSSISSTYYHNNSKWLFSVVLFTSAALALVPLLNHTPENIQFLAFFIVAAIMFVAASPAYREDLVGNIHTGSALVLCAATTAWLILTSGVPYIALVGVAVGIIRRKEFVFWLEIGLLVSLYSEIFVLLF